MAKAGHVRGHVDPTKITDYLLSETTEKSRSRCRFLLRFGFRRERPGILCAALLDHLRDGDVVPRGRSGFGEHCNVSGPLRSPDGRDPTVTTCWTKRAGEEVWRFTTLLPR